MRFGRCSKAAEARECLGGQENRSGRGSKAAEARECHGGQEGQG